ncbi:MAG: aspartate aminotransferase family protein [Burkholderiales bacterium]|nr:aspartate aminotransferase family protein [Anaerolineae bacterium]
MVTTSDLTTSIFDAEHTYIAQTYARAPFVLARGEGVTLYDIDGNAYEDWVAGIAVNALGYGDPELVQAIQEAAAGIIHASNLYLTPPQVEVAQMLCELSFADRVFFCNSGTEANEGAIKFARRLQYERGLHDKTDIVCFNGAFHGRTIGTLSLTPREKYQKPFKPLMPGVVVADFNDIASIEAAIGPNTAAVFVEPVQGEGGIYPATPEFMKALRELCDKHGAVLVFDEIQCGVGRTGTLWAHEAYDVTPDIMTLAKPLAGGLPVGAILMTEEVASAMHAGDHGSTFSAGPLVMSAAKVILSRVSRPEFLGHVNEVGEYLMERLSEINSPLIKEVRGQGLIVGVELTTDAAALVKAGYEQGVIMAVAGPNVLRFVPPLITEKSNVDNLIEKLTTILAEAGNS